MIPGAVIAMVALHVAVRLGPVLPWPWRVAAVVPLGLGTVLNVLAAKSFARHGVSVTPFRESAALVVDGIYGISRNPMYLGIVLVLIGTATAMGSPAPWLVIPALTVGIDIGLIRPEERLLQHSFGEAYSRYTRRVHRWL